jgi:hypothetical protein
MRPRLIVALLAALALPAAALPGLAGGDEPRVKAPKSGSSYEGKTEKGRAVALSIDGKAVGFFFAAFSCDGTIARMSIQDIPLKRTKHGYKFGIHAYAHVGFDDGAPEQDGPAIVWGRFGRQARRAAGHVSVGVQRCESGRLDWTVKKS